MMFAELAPPVLGATGSKTCGGREQRVMRTFKPKGSTTAPLRLIVSRGACARRTLKVHDSAANSSATIADTHERTSASATNST
eukprot:scaffold253263_cov30-Tisochrysis_lutea.AAC.2